MVLLFRGNVRQTDRTNNAHLPTMLNIELKLRSLFTARLCTAEQITHKQTPCELKKLQFDVFQVLTIV